MPSGAAVDPARLYEAMVYSAYLVERLGDAYAPVFERLADEWDAYQRGLNLRERARRVLDEAEANGTDAPHPGWRRSGTP